MSGLSPLDLLSDLVADARKAGAEAADAVLIDSASLSVGMRLGALERLERAESGDVGLRVLIGKRQAFVSSSDRSKAALAQLVERAVAMARAIPEDPFCGLADPAELATAFPDLDVCDPQEPDAETLIGMVRSAEDAARSVSGVTNSEGAEAGWGRSGVAIVASNGFSHAYSVTSSSLSVSVLAGTNDQGMERDYDYSSAVFLADLRAAEEIGHEAGRRAVRRLGARKVPTKQVPVIFDPRVARGLVSSLAGAINGAGVARGTSFLKDKLGQVIFPRGIRIMDDPHRRRGLRSRPCDGEGIATQPRAIVEDGVLTTWLLDLRSARQLGMRSTGHASRGTSSPPSPSASNFYMEAGHVTPAEMIHDISEGFYITDLSGQGVNGVTGDYSRGASGFWIKGGELAFAVNEVTVAGNLKDMFLNITPANDLTLRHGIDSPTLRIDGLMVAGR
ncbi:TldE protein part of TldE/TldD proteolytic complex [Paramagnetospirillum magnetotacticum MS-1]|uniref:TldE protein part of TldE/TldD proteolytic complex n=1 Tax=Paramagnetospirillum magnetotacticum MS-1 TaxID=272627 RepID=A0A0C2YR98_PARME|nr:TldD/PmbA family protein [Paramagnetospirillum magnetotacticum]KIL97638.1 TldE protein part of TldE/TldD proteolytic complex [Paramagnetospirillum magnetotacticum MS-1]